MNKKVRDLSFDIIENSFDGIFITDGEANTILVNKSYEVITGLKKEDLLGKNMKDLVKSKTVSCSGTLLCLKENEPITLEQEFATKKKALITSSPIRDEKGNILFVITNVRDMTEIYRLKDKINHSEKNSFKFKSLLNNFLTQNKLSSSFIFNDEKSLNIIKLANKVAKTDFTVSIFGETGVGKEVFSQYIHENSLRSSEVFLKLNCAEFSSSLIESELFGYDKGTFTGGNKNGKMGLFEMANGGTLFLDEIGELDPSVQTKLLRVLQEKEVRRLGGSSPVKIDVRIIVATNKNLETLVKEGKFREDLFYRLNVFPITIPPLKERREDILPLAESFLEKLNKKYSTNKIFSAVALNALAAYDFPGNIRELKNIIERSYIINDDVIYLENLFPKKTISPSDIPGAHFNLKERLKEIESEFIEAAYEKHKNIRKAAKSLEMDPATFLRKRKKNNEEYI